MLTWSLIRKGGSWLVAFVKRDADDEESLPTAPHPRLGTPLRCQVLFKKGPVEGGATGEQQKFIHVKRIMHMKSEHDIAPQDVGGVFVMLKRGALVKHALTLLRS